MIHEIAEEPRSSSSNHSVTQVLHALQNFVLFHRLGLELVDLFLGLTLTLSVLPSVVSERGCFFGRLELLLLRAGVCYQKQMVMNERTLLL